MKVADYYYGAVLSSLFNAGIRPALIEGGESRRVYEFTTDQGDFRLFVKYRSNPLNKTKVDYTSWQFVFSDDEVKELRKYIDDKKHLSVALVCGCQGMGSSELAVLHKEEVQKILDAGKNSITVSRRKGEKAFRVFVGGGRSDALQVKANRLY